jgi:hypothetical protein
MKINATYEDTEENMVDFAATQGWTPKVSNPEPLTEENKDTHTTEIDNPVTLSEFLSTWAQNQLQRLIAEPTKRAIQRQVMVSVRESQAIVDEQVKDNLTVNIE